MKIPVVVKASNGGSSVGVVIVKDEKDYDAALKECFALEDTIVIEEFVEGREFSVGVVDGKALPIVEIIPKTGWYDYKNKFFRVQQKMYVRHKLMKNLQRKCRNWQRKHVKHLE